MTVGPEANGILRVRIDESARELVVDALDVLAAVTEESLAHAAVDEQEDVRSRLAQTGALRQQAAEALGPVQLSGQDDLVVDVVRAIASHAAYELDALLEVVAGNRAPLGDQALAQLRDRAAAAAGAVDALIACEANRDAT